MSCFHYSGYSNTEICISVMEVEGTPTVTEPSKTPELDADLPKKGVPRLVIDKLVLENFKSYAGVKVSFNLKIVTI